MSILFTMTGLLSVVMTIAMTSAAFAGEHKDLPGKPNRSSESGFCLVERDLVAWGVLDSGILRETQPQTGVFTNSSTLRGDDMPPADYEIISPSADEWADDRSAYSESSATDEVEGVDPTIVFG